MRTGAFFASVCRPDAAALTLLAALGAIAGCSFSDSSVSPSRSVSVSSESSGGGRAEEYRRDVSDYTAAFVKSGGQYESFQSTLADLARRRGISDWENDSNTWVGVGQGLARAGVTGAEYDSYKAILTGSKLGRMEGVERGYGSEHR